MYRRYYPQGEAAAMSPEAMPTVVENVAMEDAEMIKPQKAQSSNFTSHIVSNNPFSALQNIFCNFHMDDLILIGLLFLLLREEIQDEFLILIVVALLLIGL
ncbi:MAG: hypothetical protein H7Y41_01495 [Hyphomonadaceae bacterium]|nr:hypothetical protein [Clostridia bacterium]